MGRYLLRRFLFAVVTLLSATAIVFGLSRMAGDPLMLYAKPGGYGMTEERRADLIKKLGLDSAVRLENMLCLTVNEQTYRFTIF